MQPKENGIFAIYSPKSGRQEKKASSSFCTRVQLERTENPAHELWPCLLLPTAPCNNSFNAAKFIPFFLFALRNKKIKKGILGITPILLMKQSGKEKESNNIVTTWQRLRVTGDHSKSKKCRGETKRETVLSQ
jgi:hypothetical protein